MRPEEAANELLKRRRARESLAAFAAYIDIPGTPISDDEDESVFNIVESNLAKHHVMLCDLLQGLIEGTLEYEGEKVRNAMVFMPPGGAKSTYGSVVAPAWAMGKRDNYNMITTSYATPLTLKQSRRTRQIVKSLKYNSVFPEVDLASDNAAVEEWALTNQSTLKAGGILSGITGNRADGVVIDDPIKGREDADSETVRQKTKEAIDDDLMSRLKPDAWVLYILTRWHELDPVGQLLPDDWDGETGFVRCSDGELYYVLSIPAQCDRLPDPLDREIGEYFWPEWFPPNHWGRFKANARTWSALFQQRPAPEEGTFFQRDDFSFYDKAPAKLNIYGTSDYATKADAGDFTEHGVWGIDTKGHIWFLGGWYGQTTPDIWIDNKLAFIERYKPLCWFGEGGVIRRAVEPFLKRRMLKKKIFCRLEWITPIHDKPTRARAFQAMSSMGMVHLPDTPYGHRVLDQLLRFPTGRYDDAVDMCALIGLVIDQAHPAIIKKGPKQDYFLQENTFTGIMRARSKSNEYGMLT